MWWIYSGFVGWFILCVLMVIYEGLPSRSIMSYIRGFVFGLLLGPLTTVFIVYRLYTWNDK